MGIFDRFPYSSTHEMNLDFMLGKATEIAEDMQTVATGMAQVQAGLSAISEKTEQATQAAAQAAQSASSIEGSVTAAEEAAEEAQMHNESAQTWANNAMTYKADCQRSATEAAASSSSAAQAATAAAASEDTVAQYAQAANASAQSAANNNDSAHQYANQASASASNATFHSSNAQTAATNAQTAATNANTSATNASASADRAASLKTDVETLHRMCTAAVDQAATEAVNAANSAAQAAATKTDVETLVESLPEDFTDLNNTVNQLSDEIDNIQIEGYTKSEYADITHEANIYAEQYAEIENGKIKISTGSGYQYARINVVPGETYRTTGLYAYSGIRPAMYTDADGNILLRSPTSTPSSPSHTTVETTAPVNAVYLYVSEYTSNQITIESKGIYYLESETVPQIDVVINRNGYPDTTITTHQNGDIRQTVEVFNGTEQPNNAVLPRAVFVYADGAWKTVVNNEDDNCPVSLSSGYIGAGHGYARTYKVTLANHGLTYADIGSEWESGNSYLRRWWVVRILDENNFVLIGQNASNDYDTDQWGDGATLRHISGGVHTADLENITKTQYLLAPIDKNHVKKVLLDGVTEASENGTYKAQDFVDIIDEYDIVNPQSIAPEIVANAPTGGYTDNPAINTGAAFLHFSNVYRFLSDGTMLIFSLLDNSVPVALNYWGATQYAQKSAANVFGGALFRIVPKTLPFTVNGNSIDLRNPFNMESWNFTVNATAEYWENPDMPPDRVVQLYTDGNGTYKAGYAVGYLPVALGNGATRKNNINNALYMFNTKKVYPHLIDEQAGTWDAYTPFECVAYRKPVLNVADNHTDAYFIPCGEKCYLYADYHTIADDRIKVPADYIGKPITVIEKSSNTTVYGTIATDEIRIRTSSASPAYAVVQIG